MRKEIHLEELIVFRLVLSCNFYTNTIILLLVQIKQNESFNVFINSIFRSGKSKNNYVAPYEDKCKGLSQMKQIN